MRVRARGNARPLPRPGQTGNDVQSRLYGSEGNGKAEAEGGEQTPARTFEKNERYRHLELPDDLFAALLATLPPREDRDLAAPLFPDLTDARLRMAITRACKATGTPHFSPHGLRRRRGSLHYKRTSSLAEVAELLGDSKRVAADHYVYALTDYREVDRSIAPTRAYP